YVALAAPVFLLVVPLVALTVQTRPATAEKTVADAARALPGLEVGEALRARSFWLIGLAQLFYALAASGTTVHAIPHFIGAGWDAARAALIMSVVFAIAGAGKLGMGVLADRAGGRVALALTFAVCALGTLCLLFAASVAGATAFLVLYGVTIGAP